MFKFSNIKLHDEYKEKERAVLLLSFLLPFILLVAILISKHVFPFGEKCILRTDFYHQYLPFHADLQYKLKNFGSLFYTHKVGLGTNFITIMAYYLMCPLNLFLFFVGDAFVLEFITVSVVIKISLAGLFMGYYLVKKYKTDSFVVIFFSLFYAFSAYIGAYYWNIMWLDNVLLFPLLMHGFEKMYNGGKPYTYIITLALTILCNYYIGIITCIFLVIYFVFYSIINDVKIKEIFFRLAKTATYSICGVLLSCIILVPVVYAFKTTASSDFNFPSSAREYFSIIEVIARHLIFVKVENGIEYWPNIYCGIFVFGLFTLYLLSKKYKIKEKLCYSILILFFIASFSINVIDFVWHICKFPNSLPCRQSFTYNFILLSVCIKPLLKLKSLTPKQIALSFAIPIIFIILIGKSVVNDYIGFYSIYCAIILLFIYMILLLAYKNKKFDKNIILYISIIIISFEAFINLYQTSITTIVRNDYMKNTQSIKSMAKGIDNITDGFYRIERATMKTKDDGAFLHFNSASIFSSTAYADGTDFYKTMGMEASTNAYSVTGSTPFADSLLSVQYKIYEKKNDDVKGLNQRLIADDETSYLYQNLDTLPFSYVLTDQFLKDYDRTSGNPATVQNNFSRTLKLGTMLDKKTVDIDGTEAKYTVEEDGDYYVFIRDKGIKEITVIYPTTTKTYKNMNRGYFIELGYQKKGTKLEFRNDTNKDELLMELFRFNFDALHKVVENINSNYTFKMNKYTDDSFDYNMNSKIDGTCLVTVPYDEGYTLYVDGQKTEIKKVMDFFLGFDIKKGEHNIKLKFVPKGFMLGCMLSALGILMYIMIYLILDKHILYKKNSSC